MYFSISRLRSRSLVRQLRHAHLVSRHIEQKRIRKQKVRIGHVADEVISDAESEIEPVEALRRQHVEVLRPHRPVVVPRLVFHVAREQPHHAAHFIGRPLDRRLNCGERRHRIARIAHHVRQVGQRVDQSARIMPARQKRSTRMLLHDDNAQGLGARRHFNSHRAKHLSAPGNSAHRQRRCATPSSPCAPRNRNVMRRQRLRQVFDGPLKLDEMPPPDRSDRLQFRPTMLLAEVAVGDTPAATAVPSTLRKPRRFNSDSAMRREKTTRPAYARRACASASPAVRKFSTTSLLFMLANLQIIVHARRTMVSGRTSVL